MPTRTSLELHAGFCRVVEVDVPTGARRSPGQDVRVRQFITSVPGDPASPAFSESLRNVRTTQRLTREATVVLWGLRSTHQFLRLPPTDDADIENVAVREASEEIALLEADGARATIALMVGADVPIGAHHRREVSLTAALESEIARRIQPIANAGFEIARVLTPAMALVSVAGGRDHGVPGTISMLVALAPRSTCVAIVRDGVLLLAREMPWGHAGDHGESDEPYETRLSAELRRSLLFFRQSFRSSVDSLAVCGDVANLRALAASLARALGLQVQTLDSLTGIDASAVPEPADAFRADVVALRLAIAAGSEPAPHANLLASSGGRIAGSRALRLAAAAAAVLLILVALWYGVAPSRDGREPATTQPAPAPLVVAPAPPPQTARARVATPAPESAADPRVTRDIVVTSILYSSDRRLALVDGRIVGVGDHVGSSAVVEIRRRAIVIESPGGERRAVALQALAPQPAVP